MYGHADLLKILSMSLSSEFPTSHHLHVVSLECVGFNVRYFGDEKEEADDSVFHDLEGLGELQKPRWEMIKTRTKSFASCPL